MKAYKITGKLGDICSFVGGNEVKKGDMVYSHSESNMSIEVMKKALEALEKLSMGGDPRWADDVMPSLRQALSEAQLSVNENSHAIEQVEKQEPVAIYQYQLANGSWIDQDKFSYDYNVRLNQATVRIVYTTPQPRQAEKQEPVAWMSASRFEELRNGFTVMTTLTKQRAFEDDVAIHTTPQPQREWVGLTDEEREQATGWSVEHIEQTLKEKNT